MLAQRERPNKPNAEPVPLLGYALRANPTYRTEHFHWRRFPRAGRIAAGAVRRLPVTARAMVRAVTDFVLTAPTLFLLTGKSCATFRQKETPTKVGVFNAIPLQQGQVFNEYFMRKEDAQLGRNPFAAGTSFQLIRNYYFRLNKKSQSL